MNTVRPGAFDAIRTAAKHAAETLEQALGPIREAMFGLEIRRSAHVPRGRPVYIEDPAVTDGRRIVIAHPFDAIAMEFPGDYPTQIEEAIGWIYDRAERELDSVSGHAQNAVNLGNINQDLRMSEWMRENGVTSERLEAAEFMQHFFDMTGRRMRKFDLDRATVALSKGEV